MRWAVIQFPGSNCDQDVFHVLKNVLAQEVNYIWHKDSSLNDADAIVVPGGFSYGDYLRAGAIARFSPVMESVLDFAGDGGLVLGICNGFQVLCEAHLLPGALLGNANRRFTFRQVELEVLNSGGSFTQGCALGERLSIPAKHAWGRDHADPEMLVAM